MLEERLSRIIEDFNYRNLNLFFRSKCENYAEAPEDLSLYDDERFRDFQKLGEIRFDSGEKLAVMTSLVGSNLTERSGKKAQYEKAKKILREQEVYDASFFIFYDTTGNFRFSLIYGQAEGIKKSWSNFQRFTYFVSKDQTNKTFLNRVGECDYFSLNAIKDAFSVEKVTKAFYTEMADWYFWAVRNVTFPKDAETEANGRNNAIIRLITRLIFIWFMKERKLVSPGLFNQEKISALLKNLKPDETTYYKAILQNLFFATLNTQIEERKFRFSQSYHGKNKGYMEHSIYRYEDYFKNQEDMLEIFKDIPFLNGGLFDCLDWSAKESGTDTEVRFDGFSDKEVGLNVPNYLFFSSEKEADLNKEYGTKNKKYPVQGLLNLLSAYNFTIDENDPNDQEVALDPELLGKVFENLLASFNPETATTARKATGSYYTPREIVDYMVTQSLEQYYKTHLSDVADIDKKLEELLSPITEEPVNPFGETDSKRVVRLTEELRIVDPAVGSGAFPMGILNKLVAVLARVDHNNRLWQEAQLKAVEAVTDQLLKQKLIKQINEQFTEKNSNYGRKLYLIQKCIYGVDIQQIAIEIAKLRFFIALLVDEKIDKSKPNWGIEPLPNLDFKLMQGNSLISEFMGINLDAEDANSYGKLMKDETDELITQYQNKKTDYQYEPDRAKKEALKNEIEELIARIFESKLQGQKAGYLAKLKQIETRYASIPDIEQRNEGIKKDTEILNKNYKFDLVQAEKQLKDFTSGQKVKPFFAWKLYFAEVFREKDGFDIVIGNPPWISNDNLTDMEKDTYKRTFEVAIGRFDIANLFVERGTILLNQSCTLFFVMPEHIWLGEYFGPFREYLAHNARIVEILSLKEEGFKQTADPASIFLMKKIALSSCEQEVSLGAFDLKKGPVCFLTEIDITQRIIFDEFTQKLTQKLKRLQYALLDEVAIVTDGIQTANLLKVIFTQQPQDQNRYHKALRSGKAITFRYAPIEWDGWWVLKPEHTRQYKRPGFSYDSPKRMRCFNAEEKIILRQTEPTIFATLDTDGYYFPNSIFQIAVEKDDQQQLRWLLGILNSRFLRFYYSRLSQVEGTTKPQIYLNLLKSLPVPVKSVHPIPQIVAQILAISKDEDYLSNSTKQTKVKELERQIDQMVYELYGLTPEEIEIVEGR